MPWLDQTQKDLVEVSPLPPKKMAEKADVSLSNIVAALNDRRGIPKRAFPAFMRILGFDAKTETLLPNHVHHWVYDGTSDEYEAAYRLTARFISKKAKVGPILLPDDYNRHDYFCPIFDEGRLFIIYRTTVGFQLRLEEAQKFEIWGSKFPFGEKKIEKVYLSEFDFTQFSLKFNAMELTEKHVRETIKTNKGRECGMEMTWGEANAIMINNGFGPRQALEKLGITNFSLD